MDEMLLLQLKNCSVSSRLGIIDRGNPVAYTKLAALGYVDPIDGGFKVNDAGFALLREKRDLLNRI